MNKNDLRKLIKEMIKKEYRQISLNEGIKHIEDLKPQMLLDFLRAWNLDQKKFNVSEKVDGNFMSFGLKDGQFYVRSKNRIFFGAEEVPSLFFMNSFKRYYELLEKVPLEKIVKKLSKKYKFKYNGNIDIEGEAIPSYDHNIVIYDEKKIGDGIFVIFGTTIEDKKNNNQRFWADLAKEINQYTPIKIYSVPQVNLSSLEFDNKLIVSLEKLIKKHGNFLKRPAREPEAKELKQKLFATVKKMGMEAKRQVMKSDFKPLFGQEYEGLVVRAPNGDLIKIVDKGAFTKRKEQNWHFIDKLKTWKRELGKIKRDFEKNKDKFFTIPKKEEDTKNSIELDTFIINSMEEMFKEGMDPQEVAKRYQEKEIVPEGKNPGNTSLIFEGGNIFEGANSTVPRELLEHNIENALRQSKLKNIRYELVGNVNKPYLGDIDIAVNQQELVEKLKLNPETFWEDLDAFLKKSAAGEYKILKGLKSFHLLSPLLDLKNKQLPAMDRKGKTRKSNEPGLIQIDVFIGELEWMRDLLSGAPKESKYKANYRNILLGSLFAKLQWQSKKDPAVHYKFTASPREGFKIVQREQVPGAKKPKKKSEKVFSVDSNTVAKLLFGSSIKWNDINSFEKLYKLIMSDKFRFKEQQGEIFDEFKKTLKRNKLKIPKEIK
jgi:hypothetical protein